MKYFFVSMVIVAALYAREYPTLPLATLGGDTAEFTIKKFEDEVSDASTQGLSGRSRRALTEEELVKRDVRRKILDDLASEHQQILEPLIIQRGYTLSQRERELVATLFDLNTAYDALIIEFILKAPVTSLEKIFFHTFRNHNRAYDRVVLAKILNIPSTVKDKSFKAQLKSIDDEYMRLLTDHIIRPRLSDPDYNGYYTAHEIEDFIQQLAGVNARMASFIEKIDL